jgi:hypothetical protein
MSQRKGLADVFEATRELKRNEVESMVMAFYISQGISFMHGASSAHFYMSQFPLS